METTKLFKPLKLGRVQLQHRVVMAPLTRLRCDRDHVPLPIAKEYYTQRATEGGLIIAEATMPSARHCAADQMPGIWTAAQIKGWKDIVDAVHAKGCHIFLQICAPGRAAGEPYPCVSSSAVPIDSSSRTPKEMSEEEIWDCIGDLVSASKNAIIAGFDGVELHGANGYLIDQFIQDTCNQRTDKWGGSVQNRARFAVEAVRAVSDAIGSDRLGIRFSPWSSFQAMRMADPVPTFTHLVQQLKRFQLAYLHIIESRVNNWQDVEKTESVDFMLEAWGNQSPVLVAGGFKLDSAKTAVDEEYARYDTAVVFGRYFLSTPDLVFRLKRSLEPNAYDRSTFYTPAQPKGYIDYPFSKEHPTKRRLMQYYT
ncbi:hypothetical protein BKA67DRAFT_596016 [Truncatella angustata]|uniref:NADH:flavin oxidoreductase/NADH oxidase N-terminal domain-containing protein n=1 Tax=Truncatella angustata TaxID=152316 RepID=A0A9P8RFW4_9PEZI|nr:uncharacterized protein BKA67DRAFT_596016 [Truncatella angustata]KAH6645117.1 hypothetical protein BKA67DRAFT_596016 [Truncatella angustata]